MDRGLNTWLVLGVVLWGLAPVHAEIVFRDDFHFGVGSRSGVVAGDSLQGVSIDVGNGVWSGPSPGVFAEDGRVRVAAAAADMAMYVGPVPEPDAGFVRVSAGFVWDESEGDGGTLGVGFASDGTAKLSENSDDVIAVRLHTEPGLRGRLEWRIFENGVPLDGHGIQSSVVNTNWNSTDLIRITLSYNHDTGVAGAWAINQSAGLLMSYSTITNAGFTHLERAGMEIYSPPPGVVSDNFNRPDTTIANQAAVPSTIGADWISGGLNPAATFRIHGGKLDYWDGAQPGTPSLMVHTALETLNTAGHTFTLSGVAELDNNAYVQPGVLWHYQNPSNYYYARYIAVDGRPLQVFRVVNGVEQYVTGVSGAGIMPDWVNGKRYTFTVTSTNAYQFEVSVRDMDTDDSIALTMVDAAQHHVGGYAGFICSAGGVLFDDFRLDVSGMPAAPAPVSAVVDFEVSLPGRVTAGLERTVLPSGVPLLTRNGVRVPQDSFSVRTRNNPIGLEQVRRAGVNGIDLIFARGLTDASHAGGGVLTFNKTTLDEGILSILAVNPNARIVLYSGGLNPGDGWHTYFTNTTRLKNQAGELSGFADPNHPAFLAATSNHLQALVRYVEKQPYAAAVAGYQVALFGGGEFNLPVGYWFYSDATRAAFQSWLQQRYGTIEQLRAAWNDPGLASFAAVTVPTTTSFSATDWGAFRHPVTRAKDLDFALFWQEGNAHCINVLCQAVKEASSDNPLVGIFYGYALEMNQAFYAGHLALRKVLDNPFVDFVAAPYSYIYRADAWSYNLNSDKSAGGYHGAMDSVLANGKLFFTEDDSRTYLTTDDTKKSSFPTLEGTIANLRRNQLINLAHGTGFWRLDLFGSGWYNSAGLMCELGLQKRIHEVLQETPDRYDAPYTPEVALIIDEESILHVAPHLPALDALQRIRLDIFFRDELHRGGVNYGTYLLSDLVAGRVPDVPVYLFAGVYKVTTAQREWIETHLKQGGKTLIWMYGSGLYDETGWSLSRMSELVGMTLAENGTMPSSISATSVLTAQVSSPGANSTHLSGQPRWYVQSLPPGAQVAAYYDILNNRPAVVLADLGEWRSMYVGTFGLEPKWVLGLMKLIGVHRWLDTTATVPVYAGKGLVGIWPTTAVNGTVRLKELSDVYDLYSGDLLHAAVTNFAVNLAQWEARGYLTRPAGDAWVPGQFFKWQQTHFTLPEITGGLADGGQDPDRDGYTTFQEFIAETDPRDASSLLVFSYDPSDPSPHVAFGGAPNRMYRVEKTTDLTDAVWLPFAGPMSGNPSGVRIPIGDEGPRSYYRLNVSLP